MLSSKIFRQVSRGRGEREWPASSWDVSRPRCRIFPIQPLGWALPCVPVAGPQMGLYVLPPVTLAVWYEFDAGEPTGPSGSAPLHHQPASFVCVNRSSIAAGAISRRQRNRHPVTFTRSANTGWRHRPACTTRRFQFRRRTQICLSLWRSISWWAHRSVTTARSRSSRAESDCNFVAIFGPAVLCACRRALRWRQTACLVGGRRVVRPLRMRHRTVLFRRHPPAIVPA